MSLLKPCFLILTLMLFGIAPARAALRSEQDMSSRQGYVSSINRLAEQQEAGDEIAMSPVNPDANKLPLSQRIFNPALSKEFSESYKRTFGRTEAEQNYNMPSSFTTRDDTSGVITLAEDQNQKQRDFGLYMGRRTMEYHFDNWAKTDPRAKPAYEFKERISQAKLEVSPGYRVDGKYSIGGNTFELNLINPYVRSNVVVQMNPGAVGPTTPQETIFKIGKSVSPTVDVDWQYKAMVEAMTLVGTKRLSPALSTSLTGTFFLSDPETDPLQKGNLILAGLTWNY